MNMNPSQYPRAISSSFLVFILLFSGMAQAGITLAQKVASRYYLNNTPYVKIKEVVDTLENHFAFTGLDDIPAEALEELVRAWDDPIRLIEPSDQYSISATFKNNSIPESIIFFARFDLQKDGDALFTKLFTQKSGEKLEELPFEQAKRNWENFNRG